MGYFKNPIKDGIRTLSYSIYGFIENHDGYIMIYEPNHPNSKKNGWIFEHRYIMSNYLGRTLTKYEVVHHLNGFKKDNRIENLELLVKEKHDRIRYKDLDYTKKVYCYLCGSDKTYKRKNIPNWRYDIDNKRICTTCYGYIHQRYLSQQRKLKGIKKPSIIRKKGKYVPVYTVLKEFTISSMNCFPSANVLLINHVKYIPVYPLSTV